VRLVPVVGMHRSGTSVVARALSLLGAHLGPDDDLMPPKADNPRGFWESLSVARLHDDLLAALGGRWDSPPLPPPGWERDPRLDPLKGRLRAIVESHYSGAELAAWKDPRGSLLLPFWRSVTELSSSILCLRHPARVAASLAVRDGLAPERTARVWLASVLSVLRDDGAALRVVVDEECRSPEELARRLAAFVGLPDPGPAAVEAVARSIEPALFHHRGEEAPGVAAGPLLRLAGEVYGALAGSAGSGLPPSVVELLHAALPRPEDRAGALDARVAALGLGRAGV